MMKKIKVLHIITRLDAGGSAINTLETVRRLNAERFDVSLIAGHTADPDGATQQYLARHGLKCVFMPSLRRNIHPFFDMKAFLDLRTHIRRGKVDIVHTHTSKAGVLGRWAAQSAGARFIVHTPHGHVFYGYFSNFLTGLFIAVERFTAPLTDRLIELTARGVAEHIHLGIGKPDQWTVIPSGIDMAIFCPSPEARKRVRAELAFLSAEVVAMAVGRLERVKGHSVLLEAMALLPDDGLRLVLVGEGSERPFLQEQVSRLGLGDRVTFTGARTDVAALLNSADIAIMPSLNEGMGRSALEAMACGKPVIASRTGGVPDLVREGKEGFLVPPGNAAALAQALRSLAQDPNLRAAMGQQARTRANQEFSIETMITKIEAVYDSLTK